jgi:hypothetical protein
MPPISNIIIKTTAAATITTIMTTIHLKVGGGPILKISCI